MRSSPLSNNHFRFKEFNGNEIRAIRRYYRSYVPWIDSLKQLFILLNCLEPQAFRPIDFIIISLFEISRANMLSKRSMSANEINNWMCMIMVHLYLLLTHNTEEQILIRMHHLIPEILHSYENIYCDTNFANRFRSASNASSKFSFLFQIFESFLNHNF